MTNVPEDLRYTRDHEWCRVDGPDVVIGLTDHAQRQLGDVVFVELPEVGARLAAGEPFGSVESVKSVSEVYAAVAGQVQQVNEELRESPELVNTDPYDEGWMVALRMADAATGLDGLLTAQEYTALVSEESDG